MDFLRRSHHLRGKSINREQAIAKLRVIQDIPTLPDCFLRIQQVLRHPESDAADLADVIRTDQATSAMVLKQANSPAFGGGQRNIASIQEAVTRLGMNEVAEIAMVISLVQGFPLPTTANNVRLFWTHAFLVASIAEEIGKRIPAANNFDRQVLFTAGLLHDIGRAILGLRIDPDYFALPVGRLDDDDNTLALEQASYGIDHAEAGGILMELWGFPQNLIDTIMNYHQPFSRCTLPAAIIHLANDTANRLGRRIASIEDAAIAIKSGELFEDLDEDIDDMLQQMGAAAAD